MARCAAVAGNATGEFLNVQGNGGLVGGVLQAAAAAATAIIRETDGSGRVLAYLAAAANGVDRFNFDQPISYQGKVHVTLTGAGAAFVLYQE